MCPPRAPLFNVVGKTAEVGHDIHNAPPPPNGENTAPLAGARDTIAYPTNLEEGGEGEERKHRCLMRS